MRVFIIDDSAVFVDRLAETLDQSEGVTILGSASDEREAIESVRELRPEIVILDLQLKTGSGLRVLEAIREEIPHATIIVMTNFPFTQYRSKCLAAGAQFFLDKSTDFAKVYEICRELSLRHERESDHPEAGWVSRTS